MGLVWVHWGEGSMGGDKNSTCTDKHGRADPDLDPMTGEISPNIIMSVIVMITIKI